MILILQIVFLICVAGIFHTYIFYPIILSFLSSGKKQNQICYELNENNLPRVSILIAVYNEEKVIEKKIYSIFDSTYPTEKITVYIGSDNSTDNTNHIVENLTYKYPNIRFEVFKSRTGKAEIINSLASKSTDDIYILTDANVFFNKETIFNLVKHFKNNSIGQVGGNILNPDFKTTGISFQEKKYLERENKLKFQEGVLWGAMIGAFGGCYSIRKSLYKPVPKSFLMDDFYISMGVLSNGKKAINELEATCTEDVSNKISEEFRRKVRISAGNFQNLFSYINLLKNPISGIGFAFISHKVLRWLTPFFILISFFIALFLSPKSLFFAIMSVLYFFSFIGIVFDVILKKIGVNNKILRFITHFYSMNAALLLGFIKFISGVKTNIWKPTERYQ